MRKDNFKVIKNIILKILFILLLIIFFSLLIVTKDTSFIKNIKDYVKTDIKVLYISNKDDYKKYPIELFKKYEIDYMYINSTKLSKFEKNKLEKIINSKYLSNIIVIFNDGNIEDAIIEYKDENTLNKFMQKNSIIPEIIGDNSKIIESVSDMLLSEYALIYFPYKNHDSIDKQDKIFKEISKKYEIEYKKIDAFLLSNSQKNKLNSLLQISTVEDQILILIKDSKIVGSIREINNKKKYLNYLTEFKFIEDIGYFITHINLEKFNDLIVSNKKSIISIGKDDCKYCDEVIGRLNNICINYDLEVNYINVGKIDSYIAKQIEDTLTSLNYNDGFTTPITLIVENNKILDYVIGASNEKYFIDIFTENGIIK